MLNRVMARFSLWFASPAGTLQTFLVVLGWVALEQARPAWDPHGFVVLYVLTVYSAITQPILAYGARQAAREAEHNASGNEMILRNQTDTMRAVMAILQRMEAQDASVAANLAEMRKYDAGDARDLDEILAFVREQRAKVQATKEG